MSFEKKHWLYAASGMAMITSAGGAWARVSANRWINLDQARSVEAVR